MRGISRLVGVAFAGALVAGAAEAQTCAGFSSLQSHKMNLSANAWFAGDEAPMGKGTSFGADFNTALSSLFLGVSGGIFMPDFEEAENTTLVSARLGLEKMSGKISWCPMAVFGLAKPGGEDADSFKEIGGRLGIAYEAGGTSMKFIPFASLGYFHGMDLCPEGSPDECEANDFRIGAGLGIRFNNGMQISPQFTKSNREFGDAMVFGATVTFPFGSR
jgi:hypothetical protein